MFVFRFKFPEVSATRLASGSLNSTVLCLVLHQTLVFLLLRVESSVLATPDTHRPWFEATGHVLRLLAIGELYHWPVGTQYGRPAICLAGDLLFRPVAPFYLFQAWCMPAVPAGMHQTCPEAYMWLFCPFCTLLVKAS